MPDDRPLVTLDMDGVLCRPPFGINPGSGRDKKRDTPGKWNPLWPLERIRYIGRKPMPGAKQGLQALMAEYRCEILSARAQSAQRFTEGWIGSNLRAELPMNLRPHWRETSAAFKARMIPELGAIAHIEDDPHTARWIAELIPHVLLVDWPRNRWLEGGNIHRIKSVAEASALLQELLSQEL